MGIVTKNSLGFSIILFIGIALGYINTVLIFPNVLSEEEFGLTRILMSATVVIAQVAQMGTGNIIVKFHPYFKDDKKNTSLSLGLFISGIGLLLVSLFLFLFDDYLISLYEAKSGLFIKYFYLLFPFIVSQIFFNLFDAYLRVIFKNLVPAFLNSILLRILWMITVLLYYYHFYDLQMFINLYVGCQVLISIIALVYIAGLGKLTLSFRVSPEKRSILKKMYAFGGFTILSGISVFLINRIDILMIGKYIGLEAVAIYSIAYYMSSVIMVPAQSIARTTNVLVASAAKNNDLKMLDDLYKQTALNQLFLCSLIFILIAVNYDSLMQFLPVIYRKSFYVFFLLGVAKVVETGFGINSAIILNSKYYKVDTLLSIALFILTILTNLYFIPLYGITGAALATALSVIVFNILKFLFLIFKLHLTPFTKEYLGMVFILIISTFIAWVIPNLSSLWLDVPVRSIVLLLASLPPIYFFNLSPKFNELLDNFFLRLKRFINLH